MLHLKQIFPHTPPSHVEALRLSKRDFRRLQYRDQKILETRCSRKGAETVTGWVAGWWHTLTLTVRVTFKKKLNQKGLVIHSGPVAAPGCLGRCRWLICPAGCPRVAKSSGLGRSGGICQDPAPQAAIGDQTRAALPREALSDGKAEEQYDTKKQRIIAA